MRLFKYFVAILLIACSTAVYGRGALSGYAQQGGHTVSVGGFQSTTKVQQSYPGSTVSVFLTGTSTLATIYSDSGGTPKSNPFTASSTDASWTFYADNGTYDVTFSGTGISSPFTITALSISSAVSSTVFNVTTYGAKGDLKTLTDGSINALSSTLTSASASFVAGDVGKQIQVAGAGVAGATLYSTIATFIGPTQVSLALGATTGVAGATVRYYTDDGVAIGLATAALQANGGGTLLFPFGTTGVYGTYGKGTAYTTLGNFSGLTNLSVQCDGCTLYISGEHTVASDMTVFQISATNGITIDGFNALGEVTLSHTQSGAFHGAKLFVFANGCTNINVPRIKGQGIEVPLEFNNSNAGAYDGLPHSRNIHIGTIECVTCIYGLDAQWSMDDAVIDMLKTDTVTRDMFIYGSSNVTANIHSKNAYGDGVKLWAAGGFGLSNIHINYSSDATSTARSNSGALVTLEWIGPTAATHRNIWINFDVVFPGSGTASTGLNAFLIRKLTNGGASFDSVDRGHVLDGLTLTGHIENYPVLSGYGIIDVDPNAQWGATLDSWYHIVMRNLHLVNSRFARWSLRSLKGPMEVETFTSNVELVLQQDNFAGDVSFPSGGRINVTNSDYANRYAISGGSVPSGVVYVQGNVNVGVGWQEMVIVNTGTGGTATATLPSAVIGRQYLFSRTIAQTFRIAPQAADQIRGASAANKYMSMDVTGDTIKLTCNQTGFWDVQYYAPTADFSFQP